MNVFELVAKLALDSKEFIKGLGDAQKTTKKSAADLKSDVAKLAAEYKKQGMSASEAMKKAWEEIDKSQYETAKTSEKTAKSFFGNWDSSKFNASGDKIKNGIKSIGKTITAAGKAAVKVSAVAISAATAGVTALTKTAVDAYAQYQQLEGGVQTLFGAGGKTLEEYAKSFKGYSDAASQSIHKLGDSGEDIKKLQQELIAQGYDLGAAGADGIYGPKTQAAFEAYKKANKDTVTSAEESYNRLMGAQNLVMENADKAYKTAGLSANQYMENVTSFSASLIQSLGGDTLKAAEYANRAIVDMADNSNKMGTSMEAIQNAYSGFAKSNYTMLDNLKLGYGGTKEEMARLIKDASKMTDVQKELGVTVDESSMSFANVVNAISVMQTSLGIAGTTAHEAESTISGSFNMMKASWDNLLVALASGNQDYSAQMDALVASAEIWFQNILPVAINFLTGLADMVGKAGPIIVEKLPQLITEIVPKLLDAAVSIVGALVDALPGVMQALVTVAASVVDTISAALTEKSPALGAAFDAIISVATTALNGIATFWENTLQPALNTMWAWMSETLAPVFNTVAAAINGDEEAMGKLNSILELAIPIVGGIVAAITAYNVVMGLAKAATVAMKAAQALLNGTLALNPIGAVIVLISGFVVALKLAWDNSEKFRKIVTGAWEAIKNAAETVFNAIAEFIPEAFETISSEATRIWNAVTTFLANTWSDIMAAVITAWDAISAFFDETWTNINNAIETTWNAITAFFDETWANVTNAIETAWNAISAFFDETWTNVTNAIETAWNSISAFFDETWTNITSAVETAWNAISAFFDETWTNVTTAIETAWNDISNFFDETWTNINNAIETAWNAIIQFFVDTWESISNTVTEKWEAITGFFSDTWDDINNTLTEQWNAITSFLDEKWEGLSKGAKTLFKNIKNWMDTYLKPVFDWISDTFAPVFEAVQTAFEGFSSWLSDVFSGNWQSAWDGIVNGFGTVWGTIEGLIKTPINAVIDLINGMIGAVEGAINSIVGGINSALSINIPKKTINVFGQQVGFPGWSWSPNLSTVNWDRIDNLAEGGSLGNGQSAYVGEFAPEILTVSNGVATVQPINANPYKGLEDAIERAVSDKLDTIINKISERMNVVLDTGALVGGIAPEMNSELNRIAEWEGAGRA